MHRVSFAFGGCRVAEALGLHTLDEPPRVEEALANGSRPYDAFRLGRRPACSNGAGIGKVRSSHSANHVGSTSGSPGGGGTSLRQMTWNRLMYRSCSMRSRTSASPTLKYP